MTVTTRSLKLRSPSGGARNDILAEADSQSTGIRFEPCPCFRAATQFATLIPDPAYLFGMDAAGINACLAELTPELQNWRRRIPLWVQAGWFPDDGVEWQRRIPAWIEFYQLSSNQGAH